MLDTTAVLPPPGAPPPTRSARHRTLLVAPDARDAGRPVRLAAAALTLASILAVVAGALAGLPTVQAIAASVFFLYGLGSGVVSVLRRVSLPDHVFLSVVASLVTTLLTGFALAEAKLWHPDVAFAVLAAASLALHAAGLRRTERRERAEDAPGALVWLRDAAPALVPSVGGLTLVVVACLLHRGSNIGFAGPFTRVGPLWFAGLALVVVAVPLSARARSRSVAGLTVVALALALALMPALLYDYPIVTSAARHVGVAQVIRQVGGVVPSQGIYQRWPALFAGSGMIWDVGHVTDPLSWARWWPVLVNPVAALGVRALAARVLGAVRPELAATWRPWAAAAVFTVANVLGNAYFSPQSTCFVLALAVFVLAVPTVASEHGRARALRLAALTVIAFSITVTHQLTPYMIVPALFVLVVFRLVRPWWMMLLVGVPAVGWALINYSVLGQFINLGALGKASANAAPPDHGGHLGYRVLTDVAIYSPMTVFLVLGAAATLVALRHRSRVNWALLACAASPALLFAGNNYGNEALFRAALFSLPWLVTLLVSGPWRISARLPVVGLVLAVGAAVFCVGTDGLDWYKAIRPGTVNAVEHFEQDAPRRSVVLMTGSGNAVPGRLTDHAPDLFYVGRDTLHDLPADRDYDPAADVYAMTRALTRAGNPPAYYALISTSIGAYDDLYGIQSYAHFVEMRAALKASGYWKPVYTSGSATLYRLDVPLFRAVRDGRSG